MGYIGNMTKVILDEIEMAEKLIQYSQDKAYGIWFTAKADALIDELNKDFDYFVEVTEIKKKAVTDTMAESVYLSLKERISNLSKTQDSWTLQK